MNAKRIVYWAAVAVTGLSTAALRLWALSLPTGTEVWHRWGPHPGHGFLPWVGLLWLGLLLVAGWGLWYRRRGESAPRDPWEVLALEYVEGRVTRDEYFSRRAVLEAHRWN